ncbi:MAG: NADH-quinone oxidoreductase subunit L, partial [Ignavibacterium sp.]
MDSQFLINTSLYVLFLPLLGFVVTLLLGKKVKSIYLFENLVLILTFIASVLILYNKLVNFPDSKIVSEVEWF